jgi:uncharacterized protein YjbI with pentapeptide repeats
VERSLLVGASLRKAPFARQRLVEVDFSDADLRGADFRETEFVGCRMRGAEIDGARFTGADLRGCDLGQIDLDHARAIKGALISREQATELLRGFGLKVM